ncbi:4'-phosphopantetheinyl transferase superfamily protein [Aquimarina sp. SS2-1]|uniref:4'-phosphopantetheinyl transferase family protein n=1 Tax=Aquimarina besae TaxID=3342247 RepID=UPI0036709528
MIGNDIVDLKLAAIQSNWRRRGWLDKIFEQSEQDRIKKVQDPELMVWQLWSMKEAAYKAHQRRYSLSRKYNPKDFVCTDTCVYIQDTAYQTVSERTDNFVYTIAYSIADNTNFISKVYNQRDNQYKTILQHYIADIKGIHPYAVKLEKNENGIPGIKIFDESTDIIFSLTSHGSFSAFAIDL